MYERLDAARNLTRAKAVLRGRGSAAAAGHPQLAADRLAQPHPHRALHR